MTKEEVKSSERIFQEELEGARSKECVLAQRPSRNKGPGARKGWASGTEGSQAWPAQRRQRGGETRRLGAERRPRVGLGGWFRLYCELKGKALEGFKIFFQPLRNGLWGEHQRRPEARWEATAESSWATWATWWLELGDISWTWTKMGRFLTLWRYS